MTTLTGTERRIDVGAWLRYGILGAVAAGITFAIGRTFHVATG